MFALKALINYNEHSVNRKAKFKGRLLEFPGRMRCFGMLKKVVPVGVESRIAFLPALLIFMVLSFNPGGAHSAEDIYGGLKHKLVQDGFSRQQVANAFQSAPPPMFKLVSRTMKIREGQANYDHFLAPSEIAAARQFIADHRNCFRKAQAAYGVEPEIIAAILLVETHFGSYTGKTPTLAIFSTFAIMDQKANRDKVWKLLSPQDRRKWGREAFDTKLLDRSAWAYRELSRPSGVGKYARDTARSRSRGL